MAFMDTEGITGETPTFIRFWGRARVSATAKHATRPEKVPYFIALVLFILHITEERLFGFFPALSRTTGMPLPEAGSFFAIVLWAFTAAWLLIPFLVRHQSQFGYYLAWTFFTTMGVTELAHFVFPFFRPEPYGYFPGMATVVPLAPAAWWGMLLLIQRRNETNLHSTSGERAP